MAQRVVPAKFLVAFSYASEQRTLVEAIAEAVEARLGKGTVFYDEWFEVHIAGADADKRLKEIYATRSELVVVCLSEEYARKPWPLAEDETIRARTIQPQHRGSARGPADPAARRCPGGSGWLPSDGDGRRRFAGILETARPVVHRLSLSVQATAARPLGNPCVLRVPAEYPGNLRSEKVGSCRGGKDFVSARVGRFLTGARSADDEYALPSRRSEAQPGVIQVRGPYPWKPGRRDRLSSERAIG